MASSRLQEAFEILLGSKGGDMPNNPAPPPPPSKRGGLAPRKTSSEKYVVSLYNYAEDTLEIVEVPWKEEFRTHTQIVCEAFPVELHSIYSGSKYSSFKRSAKLLGLKVEILELKVKDQHAPPPRPNPPAPPPSRSVKGDTPRPVPHSVTGRSSAAFSAGSGRKDILTILVKLEKGAFPELTYVGKQYSKADLIKDLQDLLN